MRARVGVCLWGGVARAVATTGHVPLRSLSLRNAGGRERNVAKQSRRVAGAEEAIRSLFKMKCGTPSRTTISHPRKETLGIESSRGAGRQQRA